MGVAVSGLFDWEKFEWAIKGVTVVSVPVSDPERARRFLRRQARNGSPPRRQQHPRDAVEILIGPEGGTTALTLVTWFDSMPAGSSRALFLSSSDIRADYKMFKERGVEFVGPPKPQPWGRTETVLRDPDGNSILLQQE